MSQPRVSVVLANLDLSQGFAQRIEAFARESLINEGDLILVDASGQVDRSALPGGVRLIRPPARAKAWLVPELWATGIQASSAPFVALSTTTMSPRPGWLSSLLESIGEQGRAAIGGPIVPSENLQPALDRAIYLARYLSYWQPGEQTSPAGENVIYRRSALELVRPTWSGGFWEAEVHQALRREGVDFGLDRQAILEYSGGATLSSTLSRRFRHGLRYGATRPRGRLGRLQFLAGPLIPWVLGFRTLRNLARLGRLGETGLGTWSAWLALTMAWSMAETLGLASARMYQRSNSDQAEGLRLDSEAEEVSAPEPAAPACQG